MQRTNDFGLPQVTKHLLVINILIFVISMIMKSQGHFFMEKYLALYFFKSSEFMPHQLITYMFMHASFSHLFFNMFALFMFGRTIEICWGPGRFLSFYLFTGIGAALLQEGISFITYQDLISSLPPKETAHIIDLVKSEGITILLQGKNYIDPLLSKLNLLMNTPMLGASGAIFGILAAFGMMFPNAEMIMIPIPVPIKAKYLVIGYGLLELFLGISGRGGDNIAHFAHLGGLITGVIILLYWKKEGTLYGKNFKKN